MKTKLFSLLGLSMLFLVVFMSLGSALITFSNVPTLSQTGNSTTITVTSNQNETITFSGLIDIVEGSNIITFTIPGNIFLNSTNSSQTVTINYTVPTGFDFAFGKTYSTTFIANGTNSSTVSQKISFEELDFCEDCENKGELSLKIDISVEEGFGDDDEYWYPLDEIEVEIEVENDGDWDVDDIGIEVCLLDKETGECIMDEDDMDLSDDDFDLDEDEDKTITLSFKLDPDDLNEDNKDYELYVKATGKIDDSNSPYDNQKTCVSDSDEIEIRTDENFVILDDFDFLEVVQCGAEVQITVDVWNVGDDKIDEDELYIRVYNRDLEIDKIIDVESIRALDNEKVEFTFNIPEAIDEGWYTIEFGVYDDEDCSDNDIYENSENDKSEFTVSFKVEGSCVVEPQVMVTASLESGRKAGEELIIKATVTNTGSKLVTYELNAVDYSDWATLTSVEPSTIILNAGESKDVLIIFNINTDASGDKLFNIEVLLENESVAKQPVSVTIEKSGFSFITGDIISEGNWYLWGIGALNVILIIVIVLVALRVAKKS